MKPSSLAIVGGLGVLAYVMASCIGDDDDTPVDNGLPLDDYAPKELAEVCDPDPKPGVLMFRAWVKANWGERTGAPQNIVRDCALGGSSEHHEGRAWDWSIPSDAQANDLLKALLDPDALGRPHAMLRRAGIMYMIFNRLMWRAYPHPDSHHWAPYTGANPHTDHVHFSFSRDGAMARTSLYAQLSHGPLEGQS